MQLKLRQAATKKAVHDWVAARVDGPLKEFHNLELYTARTVGEQTLQFLEIHEEPWEVSISSRSMRGGW
jgi:hypothetical protein